MRPHVELIHKDDLMWHKAELPRSEGKAQQRNLSYDEESGAASTIVRFDSAWSRPRGYHHADTEWYVTSGEISIDGQRLGEGGYFRAPKGLCIPQLEVKEGTEVLVYREYGDFGFSLSKNDREKFIAHGGNTASHEPGALTIRDTHSMDWIDNIFVDKPPGLKIKLLYHDPSPPGQFGEGFLTVYVYCAPGWQDHRMEHHPVFEEGFQLTGSIDYNFGVLDPGTYFYRPAMIKHGNLKASAELGFCQLIRSDGDIINWNTTEDHVLVKGVAENYDPETEAPVLPGPVRSRSAGHWSEDFRQELRKPGGGSK